MGFGGPPPPPPLPGRSDGPEGGAPPPSKAALPPGDLLASIRGAGGIGALKKTKTVKDASAPTVRPPVAQAQPMNPMDAVQRELDKRKQKVSNQSGAFSLIILFLSIFGANIGVDDEDDGDW